jgi:hypothetical protein
LDFPTCILDEKLNPFIKGGYHVALPTIFVDNGNLEE